MDASKAQESGSSINRVTQPRSCRNGVHPSLWEKKSALAMTDDDKQWRRSFTHVLSLVKPAHSALAFDSLSVSEVEVEFESHTSRQRVWWWSILLSRSLGNHILSQSRNSYIKVLSYLQVDLHDCSRRMIDIQNYNSRFATALCFVGQTASACYTV